MDHAPGQRSLPIAGERHVAPESIEVHSPFDGSLIGLVPKCTAADVERAVVAARGALAGAPLPAWQRAEILDTAASLLKIGRAHV